jgi:hypothetical protein
MPATSYREREREVNQFFSFGFPLVAPAALLLLLCEIMSLEPSSSSLCHSNVCVCVCMFFFQICEEVEVVVMGNHLYENFDKNHEFAYQNASKQTHVNMLLLLEWSTWLISFPSSHVPH